MVKVSGTKEKTEKAKKARAAVIKGKNFEEKVGESYELLGAEVTRNIEICCKKVDIFAEFRVPGSPTSHRILVECKDEKTNKAQNQRVMEFQGLLDTARRAGCADSAEIITREPWSEQAKGFAKESGINLITYEGKLRQLIDFKGYLKTLVEKFDEKDPSRPGEPPFGDYYVDLNAERVSAPERDKIDGLSSYFQDWLKNNGDEQRIAILGEYGTGKTTFCQKLARDIAASYLESGGTSRIPILFNLREFTKTLKIESLVSSFLDVECGVINPRYKLFYAMNEAGIFVLIFDGFDEMAVRVDADTLEMNLQEIEKLAATDKTKVVITSRLEYFISFEEEKKSLSPKGQLLPTRKVEYYLIKLKPWDEGQINLFLKQRVPLIAGIREPWTFYRDQIKDIDGLSDLSKRPVLLDMIVKTLPRLIASDKPVNRPNLYETYLKGEIKRQKITKHRALLLSERARFSLLQRLSVDFYLDDFASVNFSDAKKYVSAEVDPPDIELEHYTRDFLTCSFLIRDKDEYRFSHRSIQEYLVAKELYSEVETNKPVLFTSQIISTVVLDFLAELDPDPNILWEWVGNTRSEQEEKSKYLGGNAITVLCRIRPDAIIGKDLSNTVISHADLSSCDLRGANFYNARMKGVHLIGAKFLKEEIIEAKLTDLLISIYILGEYHSPETPSRHPFKNIIMDYVTTVADSLSSILIKNKVKPYGFRFDFDHEGNFAMVFLAVSPDLGKLLRAVNNITSVTSIVKYAIFSNEIDVFLKSIPSSLTEVFTIKTYPDHFYFS